MTRTGTFPRGTPRAKGDEYCRGIYGLPDVARRGGHRTLKVSLKLTAFAVIACFVCPPEARANVYSWAGIEYDANTNSMRA